MLCFILIFRILFVFLTCLLYFLHVLPYAISFDYCYLNSEWTIGFFKIMIVKLNTDPYCAIDYKLELCCIRYCIVIDLIALKRTVSCIGVHLIYLLNVSAECVQIITSEALHANDVLAHANYHSFAKLSFIF